MSLKNQHILITAGPTWVAIDRVRVISNTATGTTGTLLAEALLKAGAKVTIVLGPRCLPPRNKKIRVLEFKFFEELENLLKQELRERSYDAVIHSAAVSDYKPARVFRGKLSSDLKNPGLRLVRTPKLIDLIRRTVPAALLVGFKFLPETAPAKLFAAARELGKRSRANLIVANTVQKGAYRAFIVAPQGMVPEAGSKEELVDLLVMYLKAFFMKNPRAALKCSCGKH